MDLELAPLLQTYRKPVIPNRLRPWVGVARLGSLGDDLIASSVLPLLSREFNVEVLTQRPAGVVFENNPYVDKLTYIDAKDMPPGCGLEWQQWFAKRGKEFFKFVHLSHSIEVSLALIPAQTSFYWSAEMRRKLCGQNYLEFTHDVAGLPYEFNPRFYPTEAEQLRAADVKRKIGERCIGWCISGSRLDKVYPYAPMVIARLIRELDMPVVLFGAEGKDFEIAKVVHEHVIRQNGSDRNFHLALSPAQSQLPELSFPPGEAHLKLSPPAEPLWPLRRSLTQLQHCDLVIGPDTGLMWGVAMEAMPKIVLLSHASDTNIIKHWNKTVGLHADPRRVPCWPCHQLHDNQSTCTPNRDNNGAACISDISAEAIVTKASQLLTEGD